MLRRFVLERSQKLEGFPDFRQSTKKYKADQSQLSSSPDVCECV